MRKLLIALVLVAGVEAAGAATAEAQCGGAGQVPCLEWNWCAYTTPSIFGPVCWGALVPVGEFNGCSHSRLNNIGLVCVPCGAVGEGICHHAPQCNPGGRNVLGICAYAGYSEEPTTNVFGLPSQQQPDTGAVRGIADLHTHQFSNLGFGGVLFWGAPYDDRGINAALAWCDYTTDFATKLLGVPQAPIFTFGHEVHGPSGLGNAASLGTEEGTHAVGGTGAFDGWPTYRTATHQQMYYTWVERAYQGGVRLMVMLGVSNEALCAASKQRLDFSCNDMEAVDRQIAATKELESAIDRMDNGHRDGSGWYQIAYSPGDARRIIRSGRMAVVLGIEVDTLFNCRWGANCTREYLAQQLDRYYALGVRHVFPIHQFDNAFGGAAIFRNTLNTGNGYVSGHHFLVRNCQAEGYNFNMTPDPLVSIIGLILGVGLANQGYYDGFAADCNQFGLFQSGQELLEEMMARRFIIDIDHMSRLMLDSAFGLARNRSPKYPLVSSHTIFRDLATEKTEFSLTASDLATMKELGGIVTAITPKGHCATGRQFQQTLAHAVTAMRRFDGDRYPGVAFSTDMNGFAGTTWPRFNFESCPEANAPPPLTYPFGGEFGGTFQPQVTGARSFNFNDQGLAHYGMLPDFFADAKQYGTDLEPLLNSAETYIRLWERIDGVRPPNDAAPAAVTPRISGVAGDNGWYRSDVIVEWDVTSPDPQNNPVRVHSGCERVVLTTDTPGTTFACAAANADGVLTTRTITIQRDATPPAVTAARLDPAPASTWTNQPVRAQFEAADTLSGLSGDSTRLVMVAGEGVGQQASAEFRDRAGNSTSARIDGINIDLTPPAMHLLNRQPAANAAGWNRSAVTVVWECSDGLSGVTSAAVQRTISAEGANLTASESCHDRAGNVASAAVGGINIDLAPPAIALHSRTPANAHGWNNTDIVAVWTCSDPLSGVSQPQATRTAAAEGAGQSLSADCRDLADNSASGTVGSLNIDKTPPEVTSETPDPNGAGWHKTPVDVTFRATDVLSGIDGTDVARQTVTADGANLSVTQTFTDRAGNATARTRGGINLDATPPTLTFAAAAPDANAAGWHRTDVIFVFTTADNLSGVSSTSLPGPLALTAEGSSVGGAVSVTDVAGNVATFDSPRVRIDKTAPTLSYAAALPAANANGWNNTDVAFAFTPSDGLSGVSRTSVPSPLVLSAEGTAVGGAVSVTDAAGNTATFDSPRVRIDKTTPTLSYAAPLPGANAHGWNNSDVAFAFTAADGLSGVGSTSIPSPLVVSSEGAAVGGAVTVTDVAGNSASFESPRVRIDRTPPTLTFAPQAPAANEHGWNNTDVAFAFTPADALSGVLRASIPDPLVLTSEGAAVSGAVSVIDLAGNTAEFVSPAVRIDKTAPAFACIASPATLWPPDGSLVPVAVSVTFSDALAGTSGFALTTAASSEPSGNDIVDFELGQPDVAGSLRAQRDPASQGRVYSLQYRAFDRASNTAACATTVTVPRVQPRRGPPDPLPGRR